MRMTRRGQRKKALMANAGIIEFTVTNESKESGLSVKTLGAALLTRENT
jgi:hypothetical protein